MGWLNKMYFKNISNEDLIQFHPVKTRDFMMSLTDVLDSNLFKIEDNDGVYRIFPLFYCDNIKSNNMSDAILENKCIIASRMSDETYFTFTTNGVDGLPVIPSSFLNNTFKGLNDNLTTDEYNKLVYLVRENYPFTDNIRLNKLVNGNYATYHFRSVNDDIGTILDNGILLSDSLKQNGLQVMLSDPSFHYSRHILHLKIYDFGDGDIPFDGDLSNASVTDLSVELVDSEYVDIPLTGEYRYAVIGFDASVEIIHDKPIIPDNILDVDLSVSPVIIQSGEFSEFYATGLDNGRLPVGEGHTIHFFEKIEPSLNVFAVPSIIQTGEDMEIYSKVKDSDGSLAKDITVYFYQVEEEPVPVPSTLTVVSDKDILSYSDGDSAVLSATVRDQDSLPMSNQSVVFKIGSSVLDTVMTDGNGVAEYIYSSQGSGDVTFTVECSNLQETYEVHDYWKYIANGSYTGTSLISFQELYESSVYDNIEISATIKAPDKGFSLAFLKSKDSSSSIQDNIFTIGVDGGNYLTVARIENGNSTFYTSNLFQQYTANSDLNCVIRIENGAVTLKLNNLSYTSTPITGLKYVGVRNWNNAKTVTYTDLIVKPL